MHIIGFDAMKAVGNVQTHVSCRIRLTSAKTSTSLRLNAFFSKNDVKSAESLYFVLKKRFMHIIGFDAMKALGNVQTHIIP